MKKLNVSLNFEPVGQLIQNDEGQMLFAYLDEWLANPKAIAISHSLPLRSEAYTQKECRGFFAGVLPEQQIRERVAKNLGISTENDFALLAEIGRECAGAIIIVPESEQIHLWDDHYILLDNEAILEMLNKLPQSPLLAGTGETRLSLAGAQNKVAVKLHQSELFLPKNGSISTHILKPAPVDFPGIVSNEHFCMSLASQLGLSVANTSTHQIESFEYLLVERYDRTKSINEEENEYYTRLHQEDFCQALGLPPERKYQAEGGPSLADCFNLIRKISTTPVIDIEKLWHSVVFNLLIGNHDAHGKNFSLIYQRDKVVLAPLYDLVCTEIYKGLSKKMAMKIGVAYESKKTTLRDLGDLAASVNMNRRIAIEATTQFTQRCQELTHRLKPENSIEQNIIKKISKNCTRLLKSAC